jgi:hypothetical protein
MREIEIRKEKVTQLAILGWLAANLALITIWLLTPIFGGGRPSPVRTTA